MSLPTALKKNIESFALEFVRLVRGVRLYPSKHPTLIGVAERAMAAVPFDSAGLFTVGVTPAELIVSGEFVGGKASRLASFLHARKVLRLYWTQEAQLEHVWTFAQLLSTPKLEGGELRRKLHSEGVYSIDLEPLDLEQIHRGISDEVVDLKNNSQQRRRNAWLLLTSREASPEQIATSLASDDFWANAKACWSDLGYGDSEGFTDLLLNLQGRFEAAISLLPDSRREVVLDHLAKMGKTLSTQDLVRLLAQGGREHRSMGEGVLSLLREMDGEHLVDLLAGLAASGNKSTGRFAEVYRHFSAATETRGLISLVRKRLSQGEDSGFAVEVWKNVEKLILEHSEHSFMDSEYSESLERLADAPVSEMSLEERRELLQDSDKCLERVIVGLAAEGDAKWRDRLLERLETRVDRFGIFKALRFIKLTDEVIPDLLDSDSLLIKKLFRRGLSDLSGAMPVEKQAFAEFVLAHEGMLVDTALKALAEEDGISKRHFLVTLLSSFSSAATPAFISKARTGPWYVTRNLAIVLGQQGFSCSVPILKALLGHDQPKVRKAALWALRTQENRRQGEESTILRAEEKPQQNKSKHLLNYPVQTEQAGASV
jgi:hypothetical protein